MVPETLQSPHNCSASLVQFIEVAVAPGTDVSSLKLYLYDTKGTVYRKLNLADATLFRPSNVKGSSFVLYSAELPAGSIQNGPGQCPGRNGAENHSIDYP